MLRPVDNGLAPTLPAQPVGGKGLERGDGSRVCPKGRPKAALDAAGSVKTITRRGMTAWVSGRRRMTRAHAQPACGTVAARAPGFWFFYLRAGRRLLDCPRRRPRSYNAVPVTTPVRMARPAYHGARPGDGVMIALTTEVALIAPFTHATNLMRPVAMLLWKPQRTMAGIVGGLDSLGNAQFVPRRRESEAVSAAAASGRLRPP